MRLNLLPYETTNQKRKNTTKKSWLRRLGLTGFRPTTQRQKKKKEKKEEEVFKKQNNNNFERE